MSEVQTKEEFFAGHGVKDDEIVQASVPAGVDGIYSIFDVCSDMFDAPILAINDGSAIRYMKDAVNGRDTLLSRHPEDYQLFKIGSFDKSTGTIYPQRLPLRVANLKELVQPIS